MIDKIFVPPIKIQGIKTKLVETISDNIYLTEDSIWYEPFMGSGVVGLNLAPHKQSFQTQIHILLLYIMPLKRKK